MAVVIQRGLTTHSRFAQQVLAAGQREVESKLDDIGRDAVRRANDKVKSLYDNNRTGFRSRGGVKLLGSFSYEIDRSPGPGLPATIRLTSSADPAKVASLEYGSKDHDISAVNAPNLVFNFANVDADFPGLAASLKASRKANPLKGRRAPKGGLPRRLGFLTDVMAAKTVDHPGTREGKFMRGALEGAVRAAYRKVTSNV